MLALLLGSGACRSPLPCAGVLDAFPAISCRSCVRACVKSLSRHVRCWFLRLVGGRRVGRRVENILLTVAAQRTESFYLSGCCIFTGDRCWSLHRLHTPARRSAFLSRFGSPSRPIMTVLLKQPFAVAPVVVFLAIAFALAPSSVQAVYYSNVIPRQTFCAPASRDVLLQQQSVSACIIISRNVNCLLLLLAPPPADMPLSYLSSDGGVYRVASCNAWCVTVAPPPRGMQHQTPVSSWSIC